jgi:3'-phosphoadenosine 5'-phosphosulfate sulfotransferase (PAPS reductase)/FAD synthetase
MRVPTPCTHTATTHEHGTLAAYAFDRCRCWPCTYANRDYARDRARQKKTGTWMPFIDAEPARAHIRALMAAGISYRDVASRAGLDRSTIERILYGERPKWSPQKSIRTETAEKILAVQVTG